jgi:hypothetical protein
MIKRLVRKADDDNIVSQIKDLKNQLNINLHISDNDITSNEDFFRKILELDGNRAAIVLSLLTNSNISVFKKLVDFDNRKFDIYAPLLKYNEIDESTFDDFCNLNFNDAIKSTITSLYGGKQLDVSTLEKIIELSKSGNLQEETIKFIIENIRNFSTPEAIVKIVAVFAIADTYDKYKNDKDFILDNYTAFMNVSNDVNSFDELYEKLKGNN